MTDVAKRLKLDNANFLKYFNLDICWQLSNQKMLIAKCTSILIAIRDVPHFIAGTKNVYFERYHQIYIY